MFWSLIVKIQAIVVKRVIRVRKATKVKRVIKVKQAMRVRTIVGVERQRTGCISKEGDVIEKGG